MSATVRDGKQAIPSRGLNVGSYRTAKGAPGCQLRLELFVRLRQFGACEIGAHTLPYDDSHGSAHAGKDTPPAQVPTPLPSLGTPLFAGRDTSPQVGG